MSACTKLSRALLAALLLAAQACAVPQPAALDGEQLRGVERAVRENIRRQRGRLYGIGYALRAAGVKLCGRLLQTDPGVLLEVADRDSSLAGLEVVFVAPGSPLALAGVRAGDVMLELDGQRTPTVRTFNEGLKAARAHLTLQRGGARYQVDAELARVCAVPVDIAADASLMTFSQNSAVAVPYGLLEAASDDDWLAIAIAHQIVHALLEQSTERIDDREARADRDGLLLAAQAGFDVGAAPAFWEWLASENPWRIQGTGAFRIPRPHPTLETETEYPASQLHLGIARRLPAIRATVEEIRALHGAGR